MIRHMWNKCALVSLALAACGSSHGTTDGGGGGGGGGDGGGDASLSCTLPAISLKVATLAGCDVAGTANGPRDYGLFSNPVNVAIGPSGVTYVADFDDSLLRKVETDGTVTTLLAIPTFVRPFGLQLSSTGTLWVETDGDDQGNESITTGTIWQVDPSTGDATVVIRDIGRPRGMALLGSGQIALADYEHHVIELLDPTQSPPTLTVLAGMMDVPGYAVGTGTAAQFNQPWDIALLQTGDLAVSDAENHLIRNVTLSGIVTDIAGTPGVPGNADGSLAIASFNEPKGLTTDAQGALYISEGLGHDVRKLVIGAGSSVQTVAGSGTMGWMDSDDPMQAQFYGVEGLDVSADGTRIVVADGNVGDDSPFNHVRVISP